jgi:outer membrane protein assembly factor BamD (BamD/ComL family)
MDERCSICGGSGQVDDGISESSSSSSSYDSLSSTPSSSGGGSSSSSPQAVQQRKAEQLYEEGKKLMAAKDYEKAAIKFTQAIYNNCAAKNYAYFYRAQCYFCCGWTDKVLSDADEAIKLGLFNEKDTARAYYMRGFTYGEKHNWKEDCKDQAIADLKKSADLGNAGALEELAKLGVKYKPNSGGSSTPKKGGFLGLFGKK